MHEWLQNPSGLVRYLQLQNGSLDREFASLRQDVEAGGLEMAHGIFPLHNGELPLANVWIGNHLSTTSLHHDAWENLFCQIAGAKEFTLFPPHEYHLLHEMSMPAARYVPLVARYDNNDNDHDEKLEIEPAESGREVPWLYPTKEFHPASRPLHITVEAGDVLYIPALWFHQVRQKDNEHGMCASVNYWYEFDFRSPLWTLWRFLRKVSLITKGKKQECANALIEEAD